MKRSRARNDNGKSVSDFIPPPLDQNKVAGDKATSSQDAQAQQQGQPTAAQQAQGAQPSVKMADQGCQ
jgi:hypothetical protein